MAYLSIQPIDPAMERMLAKIAHTVATCAGQEVDASQFDINRLKTPADVEPEGAAFADLLRARSKAKSEK